MSKERISRALISKVLEFQLPVAHMEHDRVRQVGRIGMNGGAKMDGRPPVWPKLASSTGSEVKQVSLQSVLKYFLRHLKQISLQRSLGSYLLGTIGRSDS